MNQLVIGDLHFGIKTNSIVWLESQLKLFKNQIFKITKEKNIDRVIFLGDLFDIRYSINQQVGIEVKNIIREFAEQYSGDIYFVAGNHDYYSPLEEFSMYNSYELIFGQEFIKCYPNVKFITQTPYLSDDGALFLPWYWTENQTHFDEILYHYDFNDDVKAIFCHADLSVWPGGRIASLKGKPVYSGHIHYIVEPEFGNLHNIGAALPLTFSDVNQNRYLYILDSNFKVVEKIKNETTFKFIRVYNDQIFNMDSEIFNNSYIQLCVSTSNINKAQYIDQIKYLRNTYIGSNIKLHVLNNDEINSINLNGEVFNTNINKYIEDNIPEHLNTKYELIKNKINKLEE